MHITFPTPFGQAASNLQFVIEALPKEKFNFQRNLTFPNITSNQSRNTPVGYKSVEGFSRKKNPYSLNPIQQHHYPQNSNYKQSKNHKSLAKTYNLQQTRLS